MLALVFIGTTAAEVVLLVKVGSLIGALTTFALIIATGMIGAFLAKRAGTLALLRLRESIGQGGTTLALVNGALVLAAGVTLLSPGFITDTIGLLLLLAPVRAIAAKHLHAALVARAETVGGSSVSFVDIGSAFTDRGPSDVDEDPPPPGVIDV